MNHQKGLAAMQISIQSAGIAPKVILSNPLCDGKEAHKWEWVIHPGLETQGRQISPEVQKRAISDPTKGLMSPNFFSKNHMSW